jgi:hypothetical protein
MRYSYLHKQATSTRHPAQETTNMNRKTTKINSAVSYTKEKEMAQDYWLQVMNVGQRFEVMQAVGGFKGSAVETEKNYLHRCLAQVIETKLAEITKHATAKVTL